MENISSGEDYREDIMDPMSSGAVYRRDIEWRTLHRGHYMDDIRRMPCKVRCKEDIAQKTLQGGH